MLVRFEEITRVAKLNAVWKHDDEFENIESMLNFENKYPDETVDFVNACTEDDWDLVALIKYA